MRVCAQARVVRLPVHLHELMAKVRKHESELRHDLQRKPTSSELAASAGITEQKLAMLLKARRPRVPDATPLLKPSLSTRM